MESLGVLFCLLALVRCAFPSIATDREAASAESMTAADSTSTATVHLTDCSTLSAEAKTASTSADYGPAAKSVKGGHNRVPYIAEGDPRHKIYSVSSYNLEFPDTNDLQLTAARRWGVTPVANRNEAESRRNDLVYVDGGFYYSVANLNASIPYLVPRAALLLDDIARAFFDSLQVKRIPLHRFRVTSVLRTKADVERLRKINHNATENSCHLYGTTFDISYIKYETVERPDGPHRRKVGDDMLKYVLSEVLRDFRNDGRCYIKYEKKQSCFHITAR